MLKVSESVKPELVARALVLHIHATLTALTRSAVVHFSLMDVLCAFFALLRELLMTGSDERWQQFVRDNHDEETTQLCHTLVVTVLQGEREREMLACRPAVESDDAALIAKQVCSTSTPTPCASFALRNCRAPAVHTG